MSNWYVIQVKAGGEAKAREYVQIYADPSSYRQVFYPQRNIRRHIRGEWRDYVETLFPGYLFVITNDPDALVAQLRKVPLFTRLLGSDATFLSLSDREVAMLQAFSLGPTGDGLGAAAPQDAAREYILGMSQGIKEGNQVIILNGPLMDKTALIKKIDRHKRVAYVELELLGRKVVVKMGLEIIAKREN